MTPFYEPAWAYGGMVRASAALCRALAGRGHQVTVATALLAVLDLEVTTMGRGHHEDPLFLRATAAAGALAAAYL